MKNPITVAVTLVSVEFIMYTVSLCSPQWLTFSEGISQGLFVLCNSYEGFSSCIAVSAWMGISSLSWMFLGASSAISFLVLFTIKPALSHGKKAIISMGLNILAGLLCASALTCFLVTISQENRKLFKNLGWSFYICCATLLYSVLVSVALGLLQSSTSIIPEVPLSAALEMALPVSNIPQDTSQNKQMSLVVLKWW